jgi:mannose-6-phosphate isomerase-like protein (cupin superfamily)
MGMSAAPESATGLLEERLVRYQDLRPCTTAFIDTRTPGSSKKENFTIIGRGVSESRDQHVHISIPHGFNIGGARQPPECVNSQHSHETAEVFIVQTGRWSFILGPNREDGEIVLEPGDTISIPVHVFRGFRNVGDDVGFLFAVLGGDDPGHVTWAPYVFEAARTHGLVLLEDGSLVDTTRGESIPAGKKPMPPTTERDVAQMRRMSGSEIADCVVRYAELRPASSARQQAPGLRESPLIGGASSAEGLGAGKMAWSHGFQLRHIAVAPGATSRPHRRFEEEVILMHKGRLRVAIPDGSVELTAGDTLTIPIGTRRTFYNSHSEQAEAFVVRGGDTPSAPDLV